jgi:hypothetical protein
MEVDDDAAQHAQDSSLWVGHINRAGKGPGSNNGRYVNRKIAPETSLWGMSFRKEEQPMKKLFSGRSAS